MQVQPMKQLKKPYISTKPRCLLTHMFKRQEELLNQYPFYANKSAEELTKLYSLSIIAEVAEVLEQINWKDWKTKQKTVDQEELRYEIIDIFKFCVSLMISWGMTEKDCWQYFIAKNEENLSRIKRGY